MLNGRNFPVLVYKSEIWVELRCLGGALGALMAGAGERGDTDQHQTHTCYVTTLHPPLYIPRMENSC